MNWSERDEWPGRRTPSGSVTPHERLVVADDFDAVLQFPAITAKVLEAAQISAEIRSLLQTADGAQSILQIGINLDLFREFGSFQLHERSVHCFHIGSRVIE